MFRGPPRATRTDARLPYPTLVRSADIAGMQPAVDDGLGRLLRIVEIAHEDMRTLQQDLALGAQLRCRVGHRSEEHTSELQSLMRNSYAVVCLKKKEAVHILMKDTSTKKTCKIQTQKRTT